MRIAVIGRSENLYESALLLVEHGFEIPLVVTAKEAPEYLYGSKDFEALAERCRARFIHTPRINAPENVTLIRELGAIDLAVSINYSGVIAQDVIDLFPRGILNAHGGDLPRYRGNACMAWAIINGEQRVGLCIHKMIGGELDSGDIIARRYLNIDVNTKVGKTFAWMRQQIPPLMLEAVEKLHKDPTYVLEVQSRDPEDALRTYPRHPEDGRIVWSRSNEDILRLINASSEPFPGAFCTFDGQKLIIWEAELHQDQERYLAVPGQICEISQDGHAIVITGNGKLKINVVEYQGARSAPAAIFKSIRQRVES